MRRLLAVLLATGAAAGVTVAFAQERVDERGSRPDAGAGAGATAAPTSRGAPLPAPDAALPRTPARLATALTATTRRLRGALGRWDATGAVPRDVTYLALHHQRILRLMSARRPLGDATLARLPRDVRGEARDTVAARRQLAAIPRSPGRLPRVRVAEAAPAAALRRHYAAGQRRFGVPWSVLAAVNFVESAFGRVRSASEAG
ncbi:MAG TPA: hypothetical protein VLB47_02565, partial [Solirubrobacteraceae bacterium]|nr:hypothetical protein [Solirubrobacteraceae bacterium]